MGGIQDLISARQFVSVERVNVVMDFVEMYIWMSAA